MTISKVDLPQSLPIEYARPAVHARHITLEQLAIGEHATISGYARGERGLRGRLLALGLTRGTRVHVVRAGATGCPIELQVRGSSLVLRRSEAAGLHVERPAVAR